MKALLRRRILGLQERTATRREVEELTRCLKQPLWSSVRLERDPVDPVPRRARRTEPVHVHERSATIPGEAQPFDVVLRDIGWRGSPPTDTRPRGVGLSPVAPRRPDSSRYRTRGSGRAVSISQRLFAGAFFARAAQRVCDGG